MAARTPQSQPRPRIRVLVNSRAGPQEAEPALERVRTALSTHGVSADIQTLEKGTDIRAEAQQALAEGFDVIVAAGGDGTISAVASILRGSETMMGILPLGTFNYFARSLDIPTDLEEAVALLSRGAPRRVRSAAINDRSFLNNVSLGAYPAILKTREDVYRKWGRRRVAAYWSALVTLLTLPKPLRLTIEAEGERLRRRTPLVFAVNNAFQLEQMGLQGRDEIAKGHLALFVAPDTNRWGMLSNAVMLALGRAQRHKEFEFMAASRFRIDAKHSRHDIACDGERERMNAPYELRVAREDLSVIAPPERQEDTR